MSPTVSLPVPVAPRTSLQRPLYLSRVQAGFPSPADDYVQEAIDLNEHLIRRPTSTFYVRVSGDSMVGAGIHDGDILIVDRAEEPKDEAIVVAALDGDLTVKRLRTAHGALYLMPENDAHAPIEVSSDADLVIWGVVQHVIHSLG